MKKKSKTRKKIYIQIIIILAALMFLAFLDFLVVEKIYKPTNAKFSIPFSNYNLNFSLFGKAFSIFLWHIIFILFAISVFIVLGVIIKNYKLSLAGIILFATGWEDIFYYLIQFKSIPSQLPWLNTSPIITLSRFITQTEHVTLTGLLISALLGVIIVFFILAHKSKSLNTPTKSR